MRLMTMMKSRPHHDGEYLVPEDAASHLILDFHGSDNVTIMQCRIENQA